MVSRALIELQHLSTMLIASFTWRCRDVELTLTDVICYFFLPLLTCSTKA